MTKHKMQQDQDDDLAGQERLVVDRAPCFRFVGRGGHAKVTGEVLLEGTTVTCLKTRRARNGNGGNLFVQTSITDSFTMAGAWVKVGDLSNQQ